MQNHGLILKRLRKLNGLSLKPAAALIGKSVGWLCEVENNRGLSQLKQSEFERIVTAFNGDKHRKMFKIWVAVDCKKDKPDGSIDGAILKHIRQKRRLTLAQASKRIQISVKYLSNLEIGKRRVNGGLRDRIMRAYGYTPSSFKNFSRDEKRSQAVPLRHKIIAILNQLAEEDLGPIFQAAVQIRNTEKKYPLNFSQPTMLEKGIL